MNIGAVESIANAVLYEGYLLYPYRRSAIKNQQRFNFGAQHVFYHNLPMTYMAGVLNSFFMLLIGIV